MARFTDVDIFLAVAEAGSFRGAAARLAVTRSTVSRAIARLEDHLGTTLLLRDTASVRLTAPGLAYRRWARKAATALVEAERAARFATGAVSGTIRLTAPRALGPGHVVPILGRFLRDHPDVDVELLLVDRMVNPILDGVDLAVRTGPRLADSDLRSRRLADVELVAVASPELAGALPDMEVVPMVCFVGRDGNLHEYEGGPPRAHPLRVTDYLGLMDAVVHGVGIGVLSRRMVGDALQSGRLVEVLPDWALPSGRIWAVYPARGTLPARLRLLLDALVEGFGDP